MRGHPDAATPLPGLSTAWSRLWAIGTLVAVWGVVGWLFLTQPENRPFTVAAPLITVLALCLLWRRKWLEGSILVERRLGLFTTRLDLAQAVVVDVIGSGSGTAMLAVRPAGKRLRRFVGLQAHTAYVDTALPPEPLEALARAISGAHATGAAEAARLLRAQAAHLRAGGSTDTAPLARFTGNPLGVAGAVGAGGGTAGLID